MFRSGVLMHAALGVAAGALAFASEAAGAQPLDLEGVYRLSQYVQCSENCIQPSQSLTYEEQEAYFTCAAACGPPDRRWEKNGIPPVDRIDLDLALLETIDASNPYNALICYRGTDDDIVVPGALCAEAICESMPTCTAECSLSTDVELDCTDDEPGGPRCWWPDLRRPPACPDVVCSAAPERTPADCADADQDGVPAWLEQALGFSDNVAEPVCGTSDPCGFEQICAYDAPLGNGQCLDRDCGGACTAFHLELVAQDDREALIWIYYDFSPIPARVLDLNIVYDQDSLILEDARPLPALRAFGKQLASTTMSDGTLRLSIFDTTSAWPIPFGPIVELVFQRIGDGPIVIDFDTDDITQIESIAPLQGNLETQALLADDELWGDPVLLPERGSLDTILRLWFDFENPSSPLGYANIPDGEALCARLSVCANEEDDAARAKLVARLDALQRGALSPTDIVSGVTGDAAYFDGAFDHLRMPVHFDEPLESQAQSFSYSSWFYTEGNSSDETKLGEQVLYTHNAFNERTAFGFKLVGISETIMRLVFFDGDLLSKSPPPEEVVLAPNLEVGGWHHLGFTFDAFSGGLDLYLDGARVAIYQFIQPPSAVQCPQFSDGTDLLLHEEGDVLGGKTPEFLYTSVNRSNLFKVERMDLHGLASQQIIGDGQFSYRDANYSPILDRIVYSANTSGSFEIWIAHGDGSEPRQITEGFADTGRGIFARRPKWAPDGSAIVFESNVYDVLAQDNSFRRIYHLYYIEYDRRGNEVAIPLEGGTTVKILDYAERVADQTIEGFRLTAQELDRNHVNAHWFRGRYVDSSGEQRRGQLVMDTSGSRLNGHQVKLVDIPDNIYATSLTTISGLGETGQELELISAHRSVRVAVPQNIVKELIFYRRSFATYEPESHFTLDVTELPAPVDPFDPLDPNAANGPFGSFEIEVIYAPPASAFASQCWDRNLNGLRDTDEDRNQDAVWDIQDCYPHDIRNMYVEYDGLTLTPILQDASGNYVTPSSRLGPISAGGLNKKLQLREFFPEGRSLVRVEVISPTNALPIDPGSIATLRFERRQPQNGPNPTFGSIMRLANDEYMVKDFQAGGGPNEFRLAGFVESVDEATFSPDGDRLLLAGISKARPVLLVTDGLSTAFGAERISPMPMRVRGLNWVRQQQYYACNWFGGYLHPQNKLILNGFRGGLDNLKVYSGIRDPDAFRSEAERGFERLRAEGRERGESRLPSCSNSHLECPPYHLCIESECLMVACDPTDPYACTNLGGRCTLRPTSSEQENTGGYEFVCASDCGVDRQCFTQTCLNGPCRFCQTETQSCIECREAITQLGFLQIVGIEGCPDRRSFACEAGACITECYNFDDGQSQYLCDPTLEYCDKGRCVLLEWDWWDFAPATFSGLGEMRRILPPNLFNGYTQAVDQGVAIEIEAYGVADYLQPPEIVVEVRGGPVYGSEWSRISRLAIYNKTRVEAKQDPYILLSAATFTDMRLRMVTDPAANSNNASTGLGVFDVDFCVADQNQIAADTSTTPDYAPCYDAAQGSRYSLGYRVGIPIHEAIAACREHGRAGCPSVSSDEHDYLYGGHPGVVILEAKVAHGSVMNAITSNRVCSYEGNLVPVNSGIAKKIYYGDIVSEISNQKDAFCAANPSRCINPSTLVDFDPESRGYALLNCNVYDEPTVAPTTGSASVVFQNIVIVEEWPARAGPIVFDDGDTCTIELDAARVIPCYEWTGSDVTLDPSTVLGIELHGDLEFSLFRTFGHDEGFTSVPLPTHPLRARILNYPGGGLMLANGADLLDVTTVSADQTLTFALEVKEGRRYGVIIAQQPADPGVSCLITSGNATGLMPSGPVTVTVTCSQTFTVGGLVQASDITTCVANTGELCEPVTLVNRVRLDNDTVISEVLSTSRPSFQFAGGVPDGMGYEVVVEPDPPSYRCTVANGDGNINGADVTNILVECSAVPFFFLGVTVSGLSGTGLEVLERITGRTLIANADGRYFFPTGFAEDDAYDLIISGQPTNPAQACSFSTAQVGTMPGSDFSRNFIDCVDVPTYGVGGTVVGLTGRGLQLTLNGSEAVVINAPNPLPPDIPFSFVTPFVEGDAWSVVVTAQPNTPAEECQVLPASGAVGAADVDLTVACAPVNIIESHTVGGTVVGLPDGVVEPPLGPGSELRLVMNGGTQKLLIDREGAFVFERPLGSNSDYDVAVDRQPSDPPFTCSVTNGRGAIGVADVTNVDVTCVAGGTVDLRLQLPTSSGSAVRALLMSTASGGALVAEAPSDAEISSSDVRFTMLSPNSNDVAVLPAGSYRLFLFVNQNGSVDDRNGKPTWDRFDFGRSQSVTVTAGQTNVVVIGTTSLSFLVDAIVVADATLAPVVGGTPMACYWAPSGVGILDLPVGSRSPVVGDSILACTEGCWTVSLEVTDNNSAIPTGSYDVTCWVDNNDTNGFDQGDRLGTTVNTSPGAISVILTAVP